MIYRVSRRSKKRAKLVRYPSYGDVGRCVSSLIVSWSGERGLTPVNCVGYRSQDVLARHPCHRVREIEVALENETVKTSISRSKVR